jgi:hypothetical protein
MDEAQTAIDRLAATSVEPGFVFNELSLLRMRALVAHARGDDAAYPDFVSHYRGMAKRLASREISRWVRLCHDGDRSRAVLVSSWNRRYMRVSEFCFGCQL